MIVESRTPRIGDLLFTICRDTEYHAGCSCRTDNNKHVGIVREIELDSYGGQKHVRVEWSNTPPINYREEYGFSGTNIHNLRSEFTIVRNGKEIK